MIRHDPWVMCNIDIRLWANSPLRIAGFLKLEKNTDDILELVDIIGA